MIATWKITTNPRRVIATMNATKTKKILTMTIFRRLMSEEKQEPTPRPWSIWEPPYVGPKNVIVREGGGSVAVIESGVPYTSDEEDEANAAHIVKCVNSFDDLVAEVKDLRRMLSCFAPLVYKKEVQPHLPGNLEEETKQWLKSTRTEDVLSRAESK